MPRPFEYMPQMPRRTIDITPRASWRRAGRALLGAALLTIVLPVLVGGLALLAFLGAVAVVPTALAARQWRRARHANNGRVDTVKRGAERGNRRI